MQADPLDPGVAEQTGLRRLEIGREDVVLGRDSARCGQCLLAIDGELPWTCTALIAKRGVVRV